MKRFKRFTLLTALLLFAVTPVVFPQTTITEITKVTFGDRAFDFHFPRTNIDSTETVYSSWFSINGFEDTGPKETISTALSTFAYGTYQVTSTEGKPHISIFLQGSNDVDDTTTYEVIDTVGVLADSTETIRDGDFCFAKPRMWYRLQIVGETGNRSDAYLKGDWYIPFARRPN